MTNDTVKGAYNDTWMQPANWDNGVPSGTIDAVISTGLTALVYNTNTLAYSGSLTLQPSSTLRLDGGDSANDVVTNAINVTSIAMDTGSKLALNPYRISTFYIPAILLSGDAEVESVGNWTHHHTYNFNGAISGSGQLTIDGANNQTYKFNVPSSFSGGLITDSSQTLSHGWRIETHSQGALGTGDVTINNNTALRIYVADSIDDSATLTMNGGRDGKLSADIMKLDLNAHETIGGLVVNSNALPAATYGRVDTPASVDYEMSWISGDSILTVTNAPNDTTPPTATFTGIGAGGGTTNVYVSEPVTYSVSFNEPHTPTLTVGDFGNAGTAGIAIVGVTPDLTADDNLTYSVILETTQPGSLQLEISPTVSDLFGNATVSPLSADTVITVSALPLVGGELGVLKPWANAGINPATGNPWKMGDQYRLAFVSSATTNAINTNLADYDSFLQNVAASSTNYPSLGNGTWYVIGSTTNPAVNAREHTGTDPGVDPDGVGIFLLNGYTMIADSNTELWNRGIDAPLDINENGVFAGVRSVYTGSDADGTDAGTQSIGESLVRYGLTVYSSAEHWCAQYRTGPSIELSFYAISDPLEIVSTAPKGLLIILK